MTRSPAFQLYVNDLLGSAKVGMMSTEEIGAYMLLLFLDWQEDGFVYEEKDLAKWCRLSPARFRRAWEKVGKCFVESGGRMWNPRLKVEREKQEAWRLKSAKGGTTSQANRRQDGKGGSEMVAINDQPTGQPNANTQSSTPLQSSVTEEQPPPARAISISESELERQCADDYPAIRRFLDNRPPDRRDDWATDLLQLIGGSTGNLPADLARACADGALADPPVTNARTLRIFTARCREERVRGVVPAIHRPAAVRLSKQEIGRQNLADAIARREREATVNGE